MARCSESDLQGSRFCVKLNCRDRTISHCILYCNELRKNLQEFLQLLNCLI